MRDKGRSGQFGIRLKELKNHCVRADRAKQFYRMSASGTVPHGYVWALRLIPATHMYYMAFVNTEIDYMI